MPSRRNTIADQRRESLRQVATDYARAMKAARQFRTVNQATEIEMPRDAVAMAEFCGVRLDDWQREALSTDAKDRMLLVTRQGGKGVVAEFTACDILINTPDATVVMAARAEVQAKRLLRRTKNRLGQIPGCPERVVDNVSEIHLANGSVAIAVPGDPNTIRGIDAVDAVITDEGAFVPDDLMTALWPMLAVKNGIMLAMSTPNGKRGWYWKMWTEANDSVFRIRITWDQIGRFREDYIKRMRGHLGEFYFRQEFGCEFMDDETQLYASDLVDAALSDDIPDLGLETFGEGLWDFDE